MLMILAPVARAETVTVGSGALRAQVESDPWSLSFVDEDGRVVAESRAMPVGYRTSTGWSGATGAATLVRDGDAVVAEVGTAATTPLGAFPGEPVRVRVAPGAADTITVEVTPLAAGAATALGIGFGASSTERFYGLGERPQRVDHRGASRVETFVADGPYYPDAERAVLSAFVPPQGYRDRDDATYFPIPWEIGRASCRERGEIWRCAVG